MSTGIRRVLTSVVVSLVGSSPKSVVIHRKFIANLALQI